MSRIPKRERDKKLAREREARVRGDLYNQVPSDVVQAVDAILFEQREMVHPRP